MTALIKFCWDFYFYFLEVLLKWIFPHLEFYIFLVSVIVSLIVVILVFLLFEWISICLKAFSFWLFIVHFQVSIEYGLCEMLNREAIRSDCAPKDGNFGFNISELEAMLPTGTVDHAVKPVYEEVSIVEGL